MSKEFEEEFFAPGWELRFSGDRAFIRMSVQDVQRMSVQDVQRHSAEEGEVVGARFFLERAASSSKITSRRQ